MRLLLSIAWAGTAALLAAEPARTGLVRGVILELHTGEISVRSAPGQVFHFNFDNRTWIERERVRISGASLETGELLEVISDRDGQYARLIHVLDRQAARPPVREGQFRLYRRHTEEPAPEPAVFAGVAVTLDQGILTLKTRWDGVKTIYLRPDTVCLRDGAQVAANTLQPQTQVSVRVGKNTDSELEAYQIIWGELRKPDK